MNKVGIFVPIRLQNESINCDKWSDNHETIGAHADISLRKTVRFLNIQERKDVVLYIFLRESLKSEESFCIPP